MRMQLSRQNVVTSSAQTLARTDDLTGVDGALDFAEMAIDCRQLAAPA